MFCSHCGANMPDGSAFCTVCGAKLQGAPSTPPVQPQQPQSGQTSYGQPQYGGTQSGGHYAQSPYAHGYVQTYNQGAQPPSPRPPKKGSLKLWLLIGGGVLLLAVAAILLFVVFKVGGGSAEAGWPLSGTTMQTKFVNDGAAVFKNAVSGLGRAEEGSMGEEPFDIDIKLSTSIEGFPVEVTLNAAYDEETLGVAADVMGQSVVMLLSGDTLYTDISGQVNGYRFDTDVDLSQPMTLTARLNALAEGFGGKDSKSTLIVVEAAVNCIDEKCFEKSGGETTLTMKQEDIIAMLEALQAKAEKDDELANALDALDVDLDERIDNAKDNDSDGELIMTVSYEDGTPVGIVLDFSEGTDEVHMDFGYEDKEDGRDISLSMEAMGTTVDGSLSIRRDGIDTDYDGELKVSGGETDDTITVKGTETVEDGDVEGDCTVSIASVGSFDISYSGTVKYGMPKNKVEDDSRFDIDTADAEITDVGEVLGSGVGGLTGYNDVTGIPSAEASADPVTPVVTGDVTIGVVLPEDDTGYMDLISESIASEASYYGWEVITSISDSPDTTVEIVQSYIAQGMEAVIVDPDGFDSVYVEGVADECDNAGVICVMLLDEGEEIFGGMAAVQFDLAYAGADLAYYCQSGKAFVLDGDGGPDATADAVTDALVNDSSYGIAHYEGIELVGSGPAEGDAATFVNGVLASYPDLATFVCTDPELAYDTLAALEAAGFTGDLLCFTYEPVMEKMSTIMVNTTVTYEYFSAADIGYYSIIAIADQLLYGTEPQTYTVTSYVW
jgi:ABC-type sugar transport system substrate-binding protein